MSDDDYPPVMISTAELCTEVGRCIAIHRSLRDRTPPEQKHEVAIQSYAIESLESIAHWAEVREALAAQDKPDPAIGRVPPKGGVAAVFGQWPGTETDEQVQQALDEMS